MHAHVSRPAVRSPPRMRAARKHPTTPRPVAERAVALAMVWFRADRRAWMTEEAARETRRRSLLQDNPASG